MSATSTRSQRIVRPGLTISNQDTVVRSPLGASTGYMTRLRGDWPALIREAAAVSTDAVELSALSWRELSGLVEALSGTSLPFRYLAVHAPTKHLEADDSALVAELSKLSEAVDTIIFHPDALRQPSAFRVLGHRAVLENMDARKDGGRFVEELAAAFAELPEAGFCLDVAHVSSLDPSMGLGHELLDALGHRLRQVHLSSLDPDSHHVPLTRDDAARFAPVLERCGQVPIIMEAAPSNWMKSTT